MKMKELSLLLSSGTVLSATFVIVTALLNMGQNAYRLLTQWGEHVQMAVYLEDDLSRSEIDQIAAQLKELAPEGEIEFQDAVQAAQFFKKQMAGLAPDLLEDAEFATPFPESFTLKLSTSGSVANRPSEIEELSRKMSILKGVDEVSYGQTWVRDYSSAFNVIRVLALILAGVLVLASTLVVSNAMRALVYSRAAEIELLELIGATESKIRRPFYIRALLLVGLSVAVAIVLNLGIHFWMKQSMSHSLALARLADDVHFLGIAPALSLLLIAGLTAAVGTWLSLRDLNTGWAAAEAVRASSRDLAR